VFFFFFFRKRNFLIYFYFIFYYDEDVEEIFETLNNDIEYFNISKFTSPFYNLLVFVVIHVVRE